MARKNLLGGLMGPGSTPEAPAPAPVTAPALSGPDASGRPRYARGAIGAISRSVADLQARALAEIDPHSIDAGGLQDRLESDAAEDAALRESIREYGQQVPVLLRPHPERAGRYQIVYGRRRVLAMRDLGQPVKALIRELDDRNLVIAQGQENTARRDLSFIEKASFARQMVEAGYGRKTIGDTLSMDKTLISRLLSVAERIDPELIRSIGAAPAVGRDRWLALADAIEARKIDNGEMMAMIALAGAEGSDGRFEAALAYATRSSADTAEALPEGFGEPRSTRASPAESKPLLLDGKRFAEARETGGRLVLRFARDLSPELRARLLEEMPALLRRLQQDT